MILIKKIGHKFFQMNLMLNTAIQTTKILKRCMGLKTTLVVKPLINFKTLFARHIWDNAKIKTKNNFIKLSGLKMVKSVSLVQVKVKL